MINKGLIMRRNSEPSDVIRLKENPLFKPVGRARAASLSTLMNNMDLVGQDWDSLSSFGRSGTTVETDPSVHTISKNKSVERYQLFVVMSLEKTSAHYTL